MLVVRHGASERCLGACRPVGIQSDHVPQHPPPQQLRATGDQRRGAGRRAAVCPQGRRHHQAQHTANQAAFDEAVHEIAHATAHLLEHLTTTAPPKDREVEAAKARARAQVRYATR